MHYRDRRAEDQRNAQDTGHSYRGLGVARQCVWADQEGHSVVEIHSIATEMLSGVREGWALPVTGGEGSWRPG